MYDKEQIRKMKTAREDYVESLIHQLNNWVVVDDEEDDRLDDIVESLEKYADYLSK